jgi:hypothetical protein
MFYIAFPRDFLGLLLLESLKQTPLSHQIGPGITRLQLSLSEIVMPLNINK